MHIHLYIYICRKCKGNGRQLYVNIYSYLYLLSILSICNFSLQSKNRKIAIPVIQRWEFFIEIWSQIYKYVACFLIVFFGLEKFDSVLSTYRKGGQCFLVMAIKMLWLWIALCGMAIVNQNYIKFQERTSRKVCRVYLKFLETGK